MKKVMVFLWLLAMVLSFSTKGQMGSDRFYGRKEEDFFKRLTSDVRQPDVSYYIDMKGGLSELQNDQFNIMAHDWSLNREIGYSINAGVIYRLRNLLAVGFGLGVNSYNMSIANVNTINRTIEGQIDNSDSGPEHSTYSARMEYLSIKQNTSLIYLNIPVFLEFGNTNYGKTAFYIKAGLNTSIPLSKSFSASGEYTQSGWYPAFNVELPAIPGLFAFDSELYTGNTFFELNPIVLSAEIAAGVSFPLFGGLIISLGPVFNQSIIDIAKPTSNSNTDYWNDFNHLLELDAKATKRFMGLEIRVQYSSGVFFR